MKQKERRLLLIKELLKEDKKFHSIGIPKDESGQKQLLRGLMNIRSPKEISKEFLNIQDEYLKQEALEKGVVELGNLTPITEGIYLWQGDITRLAVDAIVNAANSGMTGCYVPNHRCIDNCIHSFSGIQLRNACAAIMREQGYEEPTGQAKITPAFNLPCGNIIHTVGPIVQGELTQKHCRQLESCYCSCLELAAGNNLESLAFCCISTGVFHFPNAKAAEIAVQTVRQFLQQKTSIKKVIFNVFKDEDKEIYERLLKDN